MTLSIEDALIRLNSKNLCVSALDLCGELIRCKVGDDKGGKQSGWYAIKEYTLRSGKRHIQGVFGNWKDPSCPTTGWKLNSSDYNEFTSNERIEIDKKRNELKKLAETEKKQRERNAEKRATSIFSACPDSGKSQYLQNKKIGGYGVRFSRGSVVVPVTNKDSKLVGLQFIYGDGSKKFLTGTAKKGSFHLIGELAKAKLIVIVEGYSTGASVHAATDWPVVVAFDAENLMPVSIVFREKFPQAHIVICGDDDHGK